MSDTGRKDLSTQAKETFTPESQKSTTDKISEGATNAGDKIASAVQPGDSKSTTQKLSDTASSGTNDAQNAGKGYVQQAQEAAGNAAQAVSDAATNLVNQASGEKK